jgi:hypothetical protein
LVALKKINVLASISKHGVTNYHFQEDEMSDVCGSQRLLDMLKVPLCNMLQQGHDGTYCGVP